MQHLNIRIKQHEKALEVPPAADLERAIESVRKTITAKKAVVI